jgi:hypothetical protein
MLFKNGYRKIDLPNLRPFIFLRNNSTLAIKGLGHEPGGP